MGLFKANFKTEALATEGATSALPKPAIIRTKTIPINQKAAITAKKEAIKRLKKFIALTFKALKILKVQAFLYFRRP